MNKGPLRIVVEHMQKMSQATGMTLEQVADFFDMMVQTQPEIKQPSTTEEATVPMPRRPQ